MTELLIRAAFFGLGLFAAAVALYSLEQTDAVVFIVATGIAVLAFLTAFHEGLY